MKNLEALIRNYLNSCKTIKNLDEKTQKAYRIDLTQFSLFMSSTRRSYHITPSIK